MNKKAYIAPHTDMILMASDSIMTIGSITNDKENETKVPTEEDKSTESGNVDAKPYTWDNVWDED